MTNPSTIPQNKWKLALLSILILTIGLYITMLLQKNITTVLVQYLAMILALYFFIKRINYEEIKIGELFLWSTFIIFTSYFSFHVFDFFYFNVNTVQANFFLIGLFIGSSLRSIIFGNMLSIGVFHLIKNKNWAMLILMILMSWVFTTMLNFDPSQFGG